MKSRFTYGMFAGFALACLFFFFFLFFFPNFFRTLTAKNSPNHPAVAAAPSSLYYEGQYMAYDARPDPGLYYSLPPANGNYYVNPPSRSCPPTYIGATPDPGRKTEYPPQPNLVAYYIEQPAAPYRDPASPNTPQPEVYGV